MKLACLPAFSIKNVPCYDSTAQLDTFWTLNLSIYHAHQIPTSLLFSLRTCISPTRSEVHEDIGYIVAYRDDQKKY